MSLIITENCDELMSLRIIVNRKLLLLLYYQSFRLKLAILFKFINPQCKIHNSSQAHQLITIRMVRDGDILRLMLAKASHEIFCDKSFVTLFIRMEDILRIF
jgi:hypothetical protein